MLEVWKDIEGYEGLYQVSNLGNVKSLDRILVHKNGHKHFKKGITLKPSIGTTGYYQVILCMNGHKTAKIHRLVANAFLPPDCNRPYINHIDGNYLNNNVTNLEWCTQKENVIHAYKLGLCKTKKENIDKDLLIEMYKNKVGLRKLVNTFGVSRTVIYSILRENGVKIRTPSEARDKYNLNLEEIKKDIQNGARNIDIAKKYKCSTGIIATRKSQFRKEGLI